METNTETQTYITIRLTEQEARLALVDPKELQGSLRSALAPMTAARQTRRGAKPDRKQPQPTQCPKCGKALDPRGASKHIKACTGN